MSPEKDHFKRTCHLPTINFQRMCLFSEGVLFFERNDFDLSDFMLADHGWMGGKSYGCLRKLTAKIGKDITRWRFFTPTIRVLIFL